MEEEDKKQKKIAIREAETERSHALSLPEELLVEILVRVPIDYLIKCKRVCKEWSAIFKNPRFIAKQLSNSKFFNNSPNVIFKYSLNGEDNRPEIDEKLALLSIQDQELSIVNVNLPSVPVCNRNREYFAVAGNCNCVVCLTCAGFYCGNAVLYNPTNGESRVVSGTYGSVVIGLGFDPKDCDFKVLRMCSVNVDPYGIVPPVFTYLEEYSSNTDSWRIMEGTNVVEFLFDSCFNGVFYWIARQKPPSVKDVIVKLELGDRCSFSSNSNAN